MNIDVLDLPQIWGKKRPTVKKYQQVLYASPIYLLCTVFALLLPNTCPAEFSNPWNFTRFPPKTANIRLTGQLSAVDYTFVQKDFGLFNEYFLK